MAGHGHQARPGRRDKVLPAEVAGDPAAPLAADRKLALGEVQAKNSTAGLGPRLRGRVLSVCDRSDELRPPCETTFAAAPQLGDRREVVTRLGAAGRAKPFVTTPGSDFGAAISPNGYWVAYVSDESGGLGLRRPLRGR